MQSARKTGTTSASAGARPKIQLPPRRIFTELRNVAKNEIDYTRELFNAIIPINITWKQETSIVKVEPNTDSVSS